jgi:hypothetical protein
MERALAYLLLNSFKFRELNDQYNVYRAQIRALTFVTVMGFTQYRVLTAVQRSELERLERHRDNKIKQIGFFIRRYFE